MKTCSGQQVERSVEFHNVCDIASSHNPGMRNPSAALKIDVSSVEIKGQI